MGRELIIVDTSVLIDYYRKQNRFKTYFAQLSSAFDLAVSSITEVELRVGIKDSEELLFWKDVLRNIKILPFESHDAQKTAEIFQYLRKHNRMIGMHDIYIAATAITHNLRLAMLNMKDFMRIPELQILNEEQLP